MRRKYSRLLTFIIAFSMILSMHVTFAVPDYEDFDGNDSFTYKQNSSSSSTWYFDEDGNKVGGPTDYWVKFTVSGDELSFETNNLSLDLVSVKGGNAYRVYTNLGSSESGLTAPDNPSGGPAGISHYSFELDKIIPPPPPPPPPPPEKADVRVEKSIEDMDDGESLAGFKFELWQDGAKVYGPETTNSSGFALFEDVDPGTYDVVELLTGGQSEIYEPEEDVIVTVDEGEEGLVTVSFENTKIDEPEMPKVKVIKKIELKTDQEIMISSVVNEDSLGGFEFELWKDGSKVYGPKTTNSSGFAIFDDVEPGTYDVVEFLTAGQQEMYEPKEDVTVTVDVDEEGTVEVTFTNYKIPADAEGSLKVHKRIMKENGSIVGSLGDGEFTVTLEGPIGEEGSTTRTGVITNQSSHYTFNNLPFGTYKLLETEIDHEGVSYGDPIYATSGNQNYEEVDNENIIIDSTGQDEIWVINVEEETPDDWEGSIKVEKFFSGEGQYEKSGIDFTLIGPDDYEKTLTTGEEGIVEFMELAEGTYTLTEDVPEGFTTSLPEEGLDIVLPDDAGEDHQVEVEVTNTEIPDDWEGDIRIVKSVRDTRDNSPDLDGFTFSLYEIIGEESEELVESKTTSESGIVIFNSLPEGDYKLYEEDRPSYDEGIDEGGIIITLPSEDMVDGVLTIDVENVRRYPEEWEGAIRIVKSVRDSRDSTPDLDGFTFRLYQIIDDEEVLIGSRTTGESGIVSFAELEEGDYILYENNRGLYIEGIDSDGLEITLPSEDMDDDILTIEVENIRRYSPPDDDDDDDVDDDDNDDDDDRPPRRREPEEEDEPEVESETITPPPVPQAPPVIETEPEPEVEVVEETTPLATLPRTGASDPTVFAGLGAALMAVGAFLKRRKDD